MSEETVVEEPDWETIYTDELDLEQARIHWATIKAEMEEANTLSPSCGHAMQRLVQFYVQFDRSARAVAEQGAVVQPKAKRRVGIPRLNMELNAMLHCSDAAGRLEQELGLTPRRRGSVTKAGRKNANKRAADAYLGNVQPFPRRA